MQHAFLFTCYSNAENMSSAISKLKGRNSQFFIHVNKRVDINANQHLKLLLQQEDVHLVKERINVNWGGFSHLQAIIALIRTALETSDADYLHLLSDSCYPIKSIEHIYSFFEQNEGKEYTTYESLPSKTWAYGGLNRIDYCHLHDILDLRRSNFYWRLNDYLMLSQMHLNIKRKSIPNWGPYYGGSSWWSLTRAATKYCLEKIEQTPNFEKRFRHTFCFEESCFQTILVNSPFKQQIVNDNLRYIDWRKRDGNIPANLDERDHEILCNTPNLFARKFSSPSDKKIKEILDNCP